MSATAAHLPDMTTTQPETRPAPTRAPLNANDRCDRCGAQAYVAIDVTGFELLFCAHHAREHGDAAVAKGGVVTIDNTSVLTKQESASRSQGADHA